MGLTEICANKLSLTNAENSVLHNFCLLRFSETGDGLQPRLASNLWQSSLPQPPQMQALQTWATTPVENLYNFHLTKNTLSNHVKPFLGKQVRGVSGLWGLGGGAEVGLVWGTLSPRHDVVRALPVAVASPWRTAEEQPQWRSVVAGMGENSHEAPLLLGA